MPVRSPRSNFVVRYCLTLVGKRTASFWGLCSAHPVFKLLHGGEQPVFFLFVTLLSNFYRHASDFFVLINSTKFLRPVSSELVIHRIRVSANLAVFTNIKVIFEFTDFLEKHVAPGLRTGEKTVTLFIFTVCLSLTYSSLFEMKEVLMHNETSRTLRFSYDLSVRNKLA